MDTANVLLEKLPVGTTAFYLKSLKDDNLDEKTLDSFKEVYSRLVWNVNTKQDLLRSLIKASGNLQETGMLWWKSSTPTIVNIHCVKLLLDLLLIDSTLLDILKNQFSPVDLCNMNLGVHLTDSGSQNAALEFLEFIVRHFPFGDYTQYVKDPVGLGIITHHFEKLKKPVNVPSGAGAQKKRGREEDAAPPTAEKKLKKDELPAPPAGDHGYGPMHWYWAADGETDQDSWHPYEDNVSAAIELAFQKGQKTKKLIMIDLLI